jgi:hypothetical protein
VFLYCVRYVSVYINTGCRNKIGRSPKPRGHEAEGGKARAWSQNQQAHKTSMTTIEQDRGPSSPVRPIRQAHGRQAQGYGAAGIREIKVSRTWSGLLGVEGAVPVKRYGGGRWIMTHNQTGSDFPRNTRKTRKEHAPETLRACFAFAAKASRFPPPGATDFQINLNSIGRIGGNWGELR